MRQILLPILLGSCITINAQTIGGDATYNFLKLAPSPQLTGLGGRNLSHIADDVTLAYSNPALLTDTMDSQLSANFNLIFAGIKNYFITGAKHFETINTTLAATINYLSYGTVAQTDPSGNITGNFSPKDFVFQVTAGRTYQQAWNYGTALKIISSDYGTYKSTALAMDFGVLYKSSKKTSIGFAAKNMGFQLQAYGNQKEDIPFDLQLGISQRLSFPFAVSVTAHRLHQFRLRNFVVAMQTYLGDKFDLTVGYDNVKRNELNITGAANGLTAFSFGLGAHFSMLQIRYAIAYYQSASAYNQLGINFRL